MMFDIDKLITHLNAGLFSHLVVTGSERNLEKFQTGLKQKLESEGKSTCELQCTTEDIKLNQNEKVDLLFVKGLENLPVQHANTYAIRAYLDAGTYNNLRSIIFCETGHYAKHFNDYDAPFYKFCLQYPISDD